MFVSCYKLCSGGLSAASLGISKFKSAVILVRVGNCIDVVGRKTPIITPPIKMCGAAMKHVDGCPYRFTYHDTYLCPSTYSTTIHQSHFVLYLLLSFINFRDDGINTCPPTDTIRWLWSTMVILSSLHVIEYSARAAQISAWGRFFSWLGERHNFSIHTKAVSRCNSRTSQRCVDGLSLEEGWRIAYSYSII